MDTKIKVGVSACLLGEKVRYDGQDKLDHYLRDTLGQFFQWVPVCPEVECGLPVPREAMRLVGTPENPRLMTVRTNIDLTDRMLRWIKKRLDELEGEDLRGFIFKGKSPSSGHNTTKIYDENGMPYKRGSGLFAAAFEKRFPLIPIEDDCRMHDPPLRENFIERVFVCHRWLEFVKGGGSPAGLVDFHTRHKLLVMSHSPSGLRELGRIVADAGRKASKENLDIYMEKLSVTLKLKATVKKHVNVLDHAAGYLKRLLTPYEKKELREIIENYRLGYLPLIVPLTIFNHHINKHGQEYLRSQHYFNPHPLELRLRNMP